MPSRNVLTDTSEACFGNDPCSSQSDQVQPSQRPWILLMATHCIYCHLVCLITFKSDSVGRVLRNLNLCNKTMVVTTILLPADLTESSLGTREEMTMFEAGNMENLQWPVSMTVNGRKKRRNQGRETKVANIFFFFNTFCCPSRVKYPKHSACSWVLLI